MARASKYSPELHDRAARMAVDARMDPEAAQGACGMGFIASEMVRPRLLAWRRFRYR